MIFPERVLGNPGAHWMKSGVAAIVLPIVIMDHPMTILAVWPAWSAPRYIVSSSLLDGVEPLRHRRDVFSMNAAARWRGARRERLASPLQRPGVLLICTQACHASARVSQPLATRYAAQMQQLP